MTKAILAITLVFLFSSALGVLAQGAELPDPGLTPDSHFYFLERAVERIGTFFTFGDAKKAQRHADLAVERLAEARAMAEEGRPGLVEKTLERYKNQLQNSLAQIEKAQAKGKSIERVMEVAARVGQATSLHLEVLVEVNQRVPQEDSGIIEAAMKASLKGHAQAVEVLKAQNALGSVPEAVSLPSQVEPEVKERIEAHVEQQMEIEKALEGIDTSKPLKEICQEQGGTPEMCAQFPAEPLKSFEQIEDFCTESGGPPELCSSLEEKCKEFGVTSPNQCFLFLSVSSVKVYTAASPEAHLVPERSSSIESAPTAPLPEQQQMIENREGEAVFQRAPGIEGRSLKVVECEFRELIFYFSDTCPPCQRVKDEGTIENLVKLGVGVSQVSLGPSIEEWPVDGVPSFVINKEAHLGYKTFGQLKELLRCR